MTEIKVVLDSCHSAFVLLSGFTFSIEIIAPTELYPLYERPVAKE